MHVSETLFLFGFWKSFSGVGYTPGGVLDPFVEALPMACVEREDCDILFALLKRRKSADQGIRGQRAAKVRHNLKNKYGPQHLSTSMLLCD